MSISENVGALSNYLARALSGPHVLASARKRQEGIAADAHGLGTRAPFGGTHEGHGAAGHAVRGDGIQLHRTHRRSRCQGAGQYAAQSAKASRAAIPARRDAQGQGLCAGGGGPDQVARPGPVRSGERHDLQGSEQRAHLFADLRQVAVRHGGARSRHRRHHARDARRLRPGRISQSDFPAAISTSRSPNSTR